MKKKYWYKFDIDYCPVCCREHVYKHRVYEKPKPEDRYKIKEVYDHCDS
jgi:hypothetical protein